MNDTGLFCFILWPNWMKKTTLYCNSWNSKSIICSRQTRTNNKHQKIVNLSTENLVSSISSPLRPKGRNGLVIAPWSGAPNQSMVGGPPSHSAINRGWGPRLAVRGSPRRRTHPTPQTLIDRGSTGAAGSSATAATEALFVDPAHPVPPPDPRPHRTRSRHPRAGTASPASSRGRPCDLDPRHGFELRAPVQPGWSAPPCYPLFLFLVVLGAVDLDLGGHVVYL
jgi:hypothetical protein